MRVARASSPAAVNDRIVTHRIWETEHDIHIELRPDEELALLERARLSGRDPGQYVRKLIQGDIQVSPQRSDRMEDFGKPTTTLHDLIDDDAIAYCAREVDVKTIPLIEEVREALTTIPGSMAQAVIEERGEW